MRYQVTLKNLRTFLFDRNTKDYITKALVRVGEIDYGRQHEFKLKWFTWIRDTWERGGEKKWKLLAVVSSNLEDYLVVMSSGGLLMDNFKRLTVSPDKRDHFKFMDFVFPNLKGEIYVRYRDGYGKQYMVCMDLKIMSGY